MGLHWIDQDTIAQQFPYESISYRDRTRRLETVKNLDFCDS